MSNTATSPKVIAFQGEPGAYSQLACREFFPDREVLPCPTFEDAFAAVSEGRADHAMIPIENSLAGRVADIHHLLPDSGLFIVGEHFLPIHHQLVAPKGIKLDELKSVMSHTMALGQCRDAIRALGLTAVVSADTAGAARRISERKDPHVGAIASALAAEIYDLEILKRDVEDAAHNTTRFLVLAPKPDDAEPDDGPTITSFVFNVRNVPAALYKAMGGFATNGVNMTKLESYQLEGTFRATQFYADIEGHPEERNVRLALEELQFFTTELKVLGIYQADTYRQKANQLP
jgi:prephenate dehydratase